MTIEQLMDRAEALNMVSDGLKIDVAVNDFENYEDALKLCEQQAGTAFEPDNVTNYRWCTFMLGDVDFTVRGKEMTTKQIKNHLINLL
jgi:hypothetical protein